VQTARSSREGTRFERRRTLFCPLVSNVALPLISRPPDGRTGAATSVAELPWSSDSRRLGAPGVDGVYVHVPFCFHKCHYCDFYSFVDKEDRQPAFVTRLIEEIAAVSAGWSRPLETIFVGGGTPTLLPPRLWRRLLRTFRERLPLISDGEFTVEANPETVTSELADILVDGGVTRVSLGAQSFEPRHLAMLERWHDPASVERAVTMLRRAGVREINLDLIFGIPGGIPGKTANAAATGVTGSSGQVGGQTLSEWAGDLDQALALSPDHLSCYGLTYETNTAMTMRLSQGEFEPCDQGLEAEMFELAAGRLAAAGFEHYEISNWARTDALGARYCRHNLIYWHNREWWAFGPSGSAHVDGLRWKNVPRLGDWLASSPWSPVVDVERSDERTQSGERLMIGLRLIAGLDAALVRTLASVGDDGSTRMASLERHLANGLLEEHGSRIRLTRKGRLLANEVLVELV